MILNVNEAIFDLYQKDFEVAIQKCYGAICFKTDSIKLLK